MTDETSPRRRILILNPLGGALLHYTKALHDNISSPDLEVHTASILEPSQSGAGRVSWVSSYVKMLVSARRMAKKDMPTTIIITWPVLGYIDLILASVIGRRAGVYLIVHDPIPLVSATGYGGFVRSVARRTPFKRGIIAHSRAAFADIAQQGFEAHTTMLPHPILPIAVAERQDGDLGTGKTVRVLGQFKPDRDVSALEEIGTLPLNNVNLEIRGRRWPPIKGWSVIEGFVPEDELQSLLRTSNAVVIPYRRFYQSGIAIRCLEYGVPIVGPAGTSLDDLLGAESPLLVDGKATTWASAIECALVTPRDKTLEMVDQLRRSAASSWQSFARLV